MSALRTFFALALLCMTSVQFCFGQDEAKGCVFFSEKPEPDSVMRFACVEEKPKYPGGDKALLQFIYDNIDYSQIHLSDSTEGKVFVQFVISSNGNVNDVKVIKGVREELDAEALRVCNKFPNWKPGKHEGKAVPVRFIVPVNFKLENIEKQLKSKSIESVELVDTVKLSESIDTAVISQETITEEPIYKSWETDVHPKFPGGDAALLRYISDMLNFSRLPKEYIQTRFILKIYISKKVR